MPSAWEFLMGSAGAPQTGTIEPPADLPAAEPSQPTRGQSAWEFLQMDRHDEERQAQQRLQIAAQQEHERQLQARQTFVEDLAQRVELHTGPAFQMPVQERAALTEQVRQGYQQVFGEEPHPATLELFNQNFTARSNASYLRRLADEYKSRGTDTSRWIVHHAGAAGFAGGPAAWAGLLLQGVTGEMERRDIGTAIENVRNGQPTQLDMHRLAMVIAENERAHGASFGERILSGIADTAAYAGLWRGIAGPGAFQTLGGMARGTAAMTAATAPGEIIQRSTPQIALPNVQGRPELQAMTPEYWGGGPGTTVMAGITAAAIENATETLGGAALNRLGGVIGQGFSRIPLPQRARAVGEVLGNWMRFNPGQPLRVGLERVEQAIRRINPEYQGFATELGEERLNDIAQGALGLGDYGITGQLARGQQEGVSNALVEAAALGAFSMGIGGAGAAINSIGRRRLETSLRRQGFAPEEVQRRLAQFDAGQQPAPPAPPEATAAEAPALAAPPAAAAEQASAVEPNVAPSAPATGQQDVATSQAEQPAELVPQEQTETTAPAAAAQPLPAGLQAAETLPTLQSLGYTTEQVSQLRQLSSEQIQNLGYTPEQTSQLQALFQAAAPSVQNAPGTVQADQTVPGSEATSNVPPAAPQAAPEPSAPPAALIDLSAISGWQRENVNQVLARLHPSVLEKISDLAAQRKTAKEIAAIVGIDVEDVLFVRLGLGIPSQVISSLGFGGANQPNPEFDIWLRSREQRSREQLGREAATDAPTGLRPEEAVRVVNGVLEGAQQSLENADPLAPVRLDDGSTLQLLGFTNALFSASAKSKPGFRELAGVDQLVYAHSGLPVDISAIHSILPSGSQMIVINGNLAWTPQQLDYVLAHEGAHVLRQARGRSRAPYSQLTPEQYSQAPFEQSANRLAEHISGLSEAEYKRQRAQPATEQTAREAAYRPPGITPEAQTRPGVTPKAEALPWQKIVATLGQMWGVQINYDRLNFRMKAIADRWSGAATVNKMDAGNAPAVMHEIAHIKIAPAIGLPTTHEGMKKLPQGVYHGLQEFDYQIGGRQSRLEAADEGFAEYFRMWVTNQFPQSLTNDQRAAAAWIESRITPEVRQLLEQSRDLFEARAALAEADPVAAAGLQINETGEMATGPRTWRQWWTELWQRRQQQAEYDGEGISRMTLDSIERGKVYAPGMRPDVMHQVVRFSGDDNFREMVENGAYYVRHNDAGDAIGPKTFVGKPVAEIMAPLAPGERRDGNVVAIAIEMEDQAARGIHFMSAEQEREFQAAVNKMKQDDPDLFARATQYAHNFTAGFDATLDAMVAANILDAEAAKKWREAHPFYAYTGRVVPQTGAEGSRNRGPLINRGIYQRFGSGFEFIPLEEAYLMRLRHLAFMMGQHQLKLQVNDALSTRDMSHWATEAKGEIKVQKITTDQIADILIKAEIDPIVVQDIQEMMGDSYWTYFTPTLPTADGRLLFGVHLPVEVEAKDKAGNVLKDWQGKPVMRTAIKPKFWVWNPKEKSTFDLIQGRMDSPLREALNAIGSMTWPIRMLVKTIRFGAVGLSHGFHVFQLAPDFVTGATMRGKNPLNPRNWLEFGYYAVRVYSHAVRDLFGKSSRDKLLKTFGYMGAEQQRKHPMTARGIKAMAAEMRGSVKPGVRALHGAGNILKNFLKLLGAGENIHRVAQTQTVFDRYGFSEKRIKENARKNPRVAPVPFHIQVQAIFEAQGSGVNYSRKGSTTRIAEKYVPFMGAYQAALSTWGRAYSALGPVVRTVALEALAAEVMLEILHWFLFHNEPWYPEMRNEANRHMLLPDPWGGPVPIRIPKLSLSPNATLANTTRNMLEYFSGRDPHFGLVVGDFLSRILPGNWLPPPIPTAIEVGRNVAWHGGPITPQRMQDAPLLERSTRYLLPYAAEQLTGGLSERARAAAQFVSGQDVTRPNRVNPFAISMPRGSINDLYAELARLRGLRTLAHEDSTAFTERKRTLTLDKFAGLMQDAASLAAKATGADKLALQQFELAVAQIALEREPQYNPFRSQHLAPAAIREELAKVERNARLATHQAHTVPRSGRSHEDWARANAARVEEIEAAREVLRLIRR